MPASEVSDALEQWPSRPFYSTDLPAPGTGASARVEFVVEPKALPERDVSSDPRPPAYEEWGAEPSRRVDPGELDAEPASVAAGDAATDGPVRPAGAWFAAPPIAGAPADECENVATALEVIALRVRTGELRPRGYSPGMGEAAAVATALTALLAADGR
jgi:hypothetical protein